MRGEEIIRVGLRRKLFTTNARDEESIYASLLGTLYSEINRRPNRRGFVSLGNSTFGLKEWGDVSPLPATPQPRQRSASTPTPCPLVPPTGITLDKLERIRSVMPADEFRRDWSDIYDQLLAAERARFITPVIDRDLLERIRPLVQRIQDFIQGRGNESPKSEVVCDWIFICYILELYREGSALWHYVNRDEVDALKYERTAKFSAACRTRVG